MTTKTQITKTQITESGPILGFLPEPPDVATRLALVNRLQGHTTSESWLPEGIWPELDGLREEALRHRRRVIAILEARGALLAKHAAEDTAHAEALKEAARGGVAPPEDARTPTEERDQERSALEEQLWATVDVTAEVADKVIEHLRAHEDEYLADLRADLTPAQEERRQAEALLASAKAREFRLHRLGSWLQSTTNDESFGRQPAPSADQPLPAQVSAEVFRDALERPWHQKRDWSGAKTELAA